MTRSSIAFLVGVVAIALAPLARGIMSRRFRSAPSLETSVGSLDGGPGQRARFPLIDAQPQRRVLAHRSSDGIEVTLFWHATAHELIVCVCDQRRGAYFEIRPEHDLAFDVYYHPYTYVDFSDVYYEDDRLAA